MSTITTHASPNGHEVTITVVGRFDFSVHRAFREAYSKRDSIGLRFVLDLSRTEYMDSSALGMVLLLREHAGGDGAQIKVLNATPDVEKILRIANFDKLLDLICA